MVSNNQNNKKRMERDVMKLIMSDFSVSLKDEKKMDEFSVVFYGPKDSPYEAGVWSVNVHLPEQYPFKSPSIGFDNRIFHPNIDEASGSVCLDVINQAWSPMYELKNIFDTFLPQLLMYPNPSDPLNSSAAKLLLNDMGKYEQTVRDNVKKYALNSNSKDSKQDNNDKMDRNEHSLNNGINNKNNKNSTLESNKLASKEKRESKASLMDNDNASEISAATLDDELSEL